MPSFYSSQFDRSIINCTIEYFLDLSSQETFEGVIDNISEAGICLITPIQLEEGQEIIIKTDIFLPSHSAQVCWIKKHEDAYKVGLKFS
jgi:hypothetical protein